MKYMTGRIEIQQRSRANWALKHLVSCISIPVISRILRLQFSPIGQFELSLCPNYIEPCIRTHSGSTHYFPPITLAVLFSPDSSICFLKGITPDEANDYDDEQCAMFTVSFLGEMLSKMFLLTKCLLAATSGLRPKQSKCICDNG